MSLLVSHLVSHDSADTGSAALAAALHRLTGFSYFSAEARARRARYRQALAELESMSDRELSEFGLHRCDIPRLAREAAGLG